MPEIAVTDRELRTSKAKEIFLRNLRKTGLVKLSANAAGYPDSRQFQIWKKDDADFAAEWELANEVVRDDVIDNEIVNRAIVGEQKAVYYKGNIIDYETVKSDRLLELYARGNNPKYRESSVNISGEIKHRVGMAVVPLTALDMEDWERAALQVGDKQRLLILEAGDDGVFREKDAKPEPVELKTVEVKR